MESSSSREYKLRLTLRRFMQALRSPQPFNAFQWTWELSKSAVSDVATLLGLSRQSLVPWIPLFAVNLILLVLLSYFLSIRYVIRTRWCRSENEHHGNCYWMPIHDGTVIYLGGMILFHYISAVFTSPGVSLSKSSELSWTAEAGQGGFWGWNLVIDQAKEDERVKLYGLALRDLSTPYSSNDGRCETDKRVPSSTEYPGSCFPSPAPTFCQQCRIVRPPRCHHCSRCQRCVLQFDHHCLWLNNCIGYNNYRCFVLTLFFLMLGCWYGVALLFWPFYEPLRAQVKEHGLKWMYSKGTGFLDLPPPTALLQMIRHRELPTKVVIDTVYPLLLGVGAIISCFLGMHVKYILRARTTLEHRILIQQAMVDLFHQKSSPSSFPVLSSTRKNPFDQGWYRNSLQILGSNLWLIFLPIPVQPPPPYLPIDLKHH